MSDSPKCVHCGLEKAVGFVRTESPTKAAHRDFRLCMPCIIDMERWMENKPNAKGRFPLILFVSPVVQSLIKDGMMPAVDQGEFESK